jgi:hypothetical protein
MARCGLVPVRGLKRLQEIVISLPQIRPDVELGRGERIRLRDRQLRLRHEPTSDDLTIYIERRAHSDGTTEVAVIEAPADELGKAPSGFRYLIEVHVAKDVIEVWTAWHNGQAPSPEEAARAILYYAEHDTYKPTTD